MRVLRFIAACLLVAGTAQAAQLCPNDQLSWPTVCVPGYIGPTGHYIPENCVTFNPGITGTVNGFTIYDPETGYRAPDAVILQQAIQEDTFNLVASLWGSHRNAARSASGLPEGLDYQQYNEMVWLMATAPRDTGPGTHVQLIPSKFNEMAAFANQECGSNEHCKTAVWILAGFESQSLNWGGGRTNGPGRSMTGATVRGLLDIYKRTPVPNPPLLCGGQ